MSGKKREDPPAPVSRDPEEEGSAARVPQSPSPRDNDPEEEGSAGRPQR
jgi:hypothetical protein